MAIKVSLMNQYTDEEFTKIVEASESYRDLAIKLGYLSCSGDLVKKLKEKISTLEINTDHFLSIGSKIRRNEENIFIKDSTVEQSTLRRWYKKEEYTPYVCSICGQNPEWQGKPLTLILDHINGDNHDDRLENLRWVCPNCNQQLETTNGKNIKLLRKKRFYCVDCGKEISRNSERCIPCLAKAKVIPTEDMPVTREELKQLIRTTPFVKIGTMYGVTDNAVRKWCDKFDLPRKVSDIRKFSDEEWELL